MNRNNPIRKLSHLGNWSRNHGFRERDRKLHTSPRAIKKMYDLWDKCPVAFDIYLINSTQTNKVSYREVGPVDPQEYPGLDDIDFADDAVNIVFTNNVGVEGVPLTGWIMAHRAAHVLRHKEPYDVNEDWSEIVQAINNHLDRIIEAFGLPDRYPYRMSKYDELQHSSYTGIYDKANRDRARERYRKALASQLGTSRAARTRNLRNTYEWYYELVAQWIITGRIRFRKLGKTVDFGPAPFGRRFEQTLNDGPMIGLLNDYSQLLASNLETMIEDLVGSAVGKVFLM